MACSDGLFPPCPPQMAAAGGAITTGPFFAFPNINQGRATGYNVVLKNPTNRDFNVDVTVDFCDVGVDTMERSCTRNFPVPANSCITLLVTYTFVTPPAQGAVISRVTVSGDVSDEASKVEVNVFTGSLNYEHAEFIRVVNPQIHQVPNQDCTGITFIVLT